MTKKRTIFSLITLLFVFLLASAVFAFKSLNKNPQQVKTQSTSLSKGQELLIKAKNENEPAYILFHSSTCLPCQEMEKIVEEVILSFEEKITFIDINVYDQSEQELINQFRIQAIPTSIFIDKKGEIEDVRIGVIPKDHLSNLLDNLTDNEK